MSNERNDATAEARAEARATDPTADDYEGSIMIFPATDHVSTFNINL
jgi:hypothetical protein